MEIVKFGYDPDEMKWYARLENEIKWFPTWDAVCQWGRDNNFYLMREETKDAN